MFFARRLLLAVGLLCATALFASAADVRLSDLQPNAAQALNPSKSPDPKVNREADTVTLATLSRVSYELPQGAAMFVATLSRPTPENDLPRTNRIRLRLLLDGKVLDTAYLDIEDPPLRLAVAVSGGHELTFQVDDQFGFDAVVLSGAHFSSQPSAAVDQSVVSDAHPLAIDFAPEGRQALYGVFRPGEQVPVKVTAKAGLSAADLTFTVAPEDHAAPQAQTLHVALHAGDGVSVGSAVWKVPSRSGPAQLEVNGAAGASPFHRAMRVAITPENDLAAINQSTFAVHLSSNGYAMLADDYAWLWGAKWGRVFIRWEIVEPTAGNYDFSRIDEVVQQYLDHHMNVLGVLGEKAPAWAGQPGPEYYAAFGKFCEAATKHFHGKIDFWDVFNEIDSKYEGHMKAVDPNSDLELLRAGIAAVHQNGGRAVCCSTGTSKWLVYDKRWLDAGLFSQADVASLHPYQTGAPEESEGAHDYLGAVQALRDLLQSSGINKPVWSTEATWIIGPKGAPYVTAPDMPEHTQAEYIVRVNLLSMAVGVPYFVHMPFYHSHHREIELDALAAYNAMALTFANASNPHLLALGQNAYGVQANTAAGSVVALWAIAPGGHVRVSGNPAFFDFYGNPIELTPASVAIGPQPIYIRSASPVAVSMLNSAPGLQFRPMPSLNSWARNSANSYSPAAGGFHVTTNATTYGNIFVSPPVHVGSGACFEVRMDVRMLRGGAAIFAVDPATRQHITPVAHEFSYGAPKAETIVIKGTSTGDSVQVTVQAANPHDPAVSELEISAPQVAPCE